MNSPVNLSKTVAPLRAYGTNFKKTAVEATVEKFKEKCHYCTKMDTSLMYAATSSKIIRL